MSKKDWVELQIKSNKVVVFSKSYCPFCKKTKNALKDCGLEDYLVFELDERDDGDEIFDILRGITGGRTVPRVFIGGEFVGGDSEIQNLKSNGQLAAKLKKAGAL